MRVLSAVLLFAALGCAARVEQADAHAGDAQDPVAQLERAGAKLTRDDTPPGNPVVGVALAGVTRKVSDDDLLPLASLPAVKGLSLFGCDNVTAAGSKRVAALERLQKLGLSNTALDDAALDELKGLTELRELHLSGSVRLTDKCAETVNGFAKLKHCRSPVRSPRTFGGGVANTLLADHLRPKAEVRVDNLSLRFSTSIKSNEELIGALSADRIEPVPAEDAIEGMTFSECLPPHVAAEVFCARFNDAEAVRTILAEPKRVVVEHSGASEP